MTEGQAPAVRAQDLGHVYRRSVRALSGVCLTLERGSFTALMGPNGSGKTTLLALIAGRQPVTEGSLEVLGAHPFRADGAHRARVGYVPQDVALDPEMSGRETLTLFAALYGVERAHREREVAHLLDRLELGDVADRLCGTYSGGQKRRLHLAVGLVSDPELLLLDEPEASLDAKGRQTLVEILDESRARGRTTIMISHELDGQEERLDHVVLLNEGGVVENGAPAQLIERYARSSVHVLLDRSAGEELRRELRRIDGVEGLETEGVKVRLTLSLEDTSEEAISGQILAALQHEGVSLRSWTWQRAGLSAVFGALTGQDLERRPRGRRQGGERRRR